MSFEIFKTYPPDRESAVAELNVRHDGTVDIPAEVFRERGELRIRIFGREGGEAWQYPLDEWLAAIELAIEVLGPRE
jgi:hypothetical protein